MLVEICSGGSGQSKRSGKGMELRGAHGNDVGPRGPDDCATFKTEWNDSDPLRYVTELIFFSWGHRSRLTKWRYLIELTSKQRSQ
jgi:hypothetical protein